MSFKQANILFLHRIYEVDLDTIDGIFEKKYKEPIEGYSLVNNKNYANFESIPQIFSSVDKWPKKTTLLCYNCECSFNDIPWFDTEEIIIQDNKRLFVPRKGVFCSENCAEAHIERIYKEPTLGEKKYFLRQLYKEIRGIPITIIQPSYDKIIMKKFVGMSGITDEEYQALIKKLATVV